VNGVTSGGSTLYCTDFPCVSCAKALVQAGVERDIYLADYPDVNSSAVLRDGGVSLLKAVPVPNGFQLVEAGCRHARTT